MKKFLFASIAAMAFSCGQSFAHHAAEGILDDELYEMIEDLLAGTPHADMTLEDLALGMASMTFTVTSMSAVMDLIEFANSVENVLSVTYEHEEDGFIVTIVTRGTNFIYNQAEGRLQAKEPGVDSDYYNDYDY